jgi:hypothetical protein
VGASLTSRHALLLACAHPARLWGARLVRPGDSVSDLLSNASLPRKHALR